MKPTTAPTNRLSTPGVLSVGPGLPDRPAPPCTHPGHQLRTRRKAGLKNFQHSLQYRPGLNPVICWMSLLNLSTPVHVGKARQGAHQPQDQEPMRFSPWAGSVALICWEDLGAGTSLIWNKVGDKLKDSVTLYALPRLTCKREITAEGACLSLQSLVALARNSSFFFWLTLSWKITTLCTQSLYPHVCACVKP